MECIHGGDRDWSVCKECEFSALEQENHRLREKIENLREQIRSHEKTKDVAVTDLKDEDLPMLLRRQAE